jgi:hypothetical protein
LALGVTSHSRPRSPNLGVLHLSVGSIVLGLISGFVGWILTEFIAKPIRRGLDIAADAQASMIEYANLRARHDSKNKPTGITEEEEKRLQEAETKYRRLSAQLYAFAQTDRLASLILRPLFDAERSATALMGLSNNVGQYGSGRHAATEEAKKALKVAPILST